MIYDRRSFLFLMAWAALASTAAAKDGDSDGGDSSGSGSGDNSGSDSGDNSGPGGGDDSDSDNSGPGNSNDDGDDNDEAEDDEDDAIDQDDVLKAVRGGEIIPLNEAIDIVKRRNPGKIIDVSLARRSFSDVYSFKVKSSAGRVVTVRMNARTGAIMGF